MRSWTPRHPSPRLERRALGRSPATSSVQRLFTVLAPTAACLLLTVAVVRQPDDTLVTGGADRATMVAMGLSNQNFAAYLPGSFQPNANRVDTFEWTNGGHSNSSMDSLTPLKATDLQ